MVILRYMPPLLGVKVVGVCGLLVGVAFLLRLAQMAYKRCTTRCDVARADNPLNSDYFRSSMDVSAASEPYVHVDVRLDSLHEKGIVVLVFRSF